MYRDYVKHEDNLINWRTTWALTIQGLTFGAISVCIGKIIDRSGFELCKVFSANLIGSDELYAMMIFVLSLFGAVIAYFSMQSVQAARGAILNLERMFREDVRFRAKSRFPIITGGGLGTIDRFGFRLAHSLPMIFVFVWMSFLSLFYISIYHCRKDNDFILYIAIGLGCVTVLAFVGTLVSVIFEGWTSGRRSQKQE